MRCWSTYNENWVFFPIFILKRSVGLWIWLHDESHKKSFSSFYFKKICVFIWSEYMMNLIKQMVFYDWFYVWCLFTLENRYSESSFQVLWFFKFFLLAGHMIWNYISGIICVWILLMLSLWLSDTRISIFIQNIFLFYVWLFRLMSISLNSFLLIRLIFFVQILLSWNL